MVRPPNLERTWSADAHALGPLREQVRQWLLPLGLSTDDVHDVVAAVNEAASNVIEHAYAPDVLDPTVAVEFFSGGGELCVTVTDQGRWLEREAPRPWAGRGIPLMRGLLADVRIDSDEAGTRVEMRRPLPVAEHRRRRLD